ncbi:MAG: V-type ATP synthase subunit B, partial [Candidatus Micrarchaeota archaeon]|nr:V-type ATP synthase subunit B [Candidatus Micrarchaeota archaeon]
MTMIKEYQTVKEIFGPIVYVEDIQDAAYNETVEIIMPSGEKLKGQVLESSKGLAAVQVFGPTTGLDTKETRIRFSGETLKL